MIFSLLLPLFFLNPSQHVFSYVFGVSSNKYGKSNELFWWQIGSYGAITRIRNIVSKREDLLKVAAAGPLAGFSLGLVLLLLGFILPPTDGIGVNVDASVFHESLLAGGIGMHFCMYFTFTFYARLLPSEIIFR